MYPDPILLKYFIPYLLLPGRIVQEFALLCPAPLWSVGPESAALLGARALLYNT